MCLGLTLFAALPASGQVPEWAELWRVVSVTLPGPAALQHGPTATFWNPAAVNDGTGLGGGIEVLQTPDVVSLSSVVVGVTQRLGHLALGVVAGRVSVADLVRTTTSPTSEAGDIPVFSQFAGAAFGGRVGAFSLGALVRAHDAQFDTRSQGGLTLDLGIRATPVERLSLGVSTRFVTPDRPGARVGEYYAGTEYRLKTASLWGASALITGRYGVAYQPTVGVEHGLSAGLGLEGRFRVDWGWVRELGPVAASWRPVLGVEFRAGRYIITVARGAGLNDVGAAFRLGLIAGITQ
ncbi:MAG TPA: hypothetical protein VGA37_15750 [Gemmatimonadales bacterium]